MRYFFANKQKTAIISILSMIIFIAAICAIPVSKLLTNKDESIHKSSLNKLDFRNYLINEGKKVSSMNQYISNYPDIDNVSSIQSMDLLVLGDKQSEKEHSFTATEDVINQSVETLTGTLRKSYRTRSFHKKGSEATMFFDISKPEPKTSKTPILIEVEEVHNCSGQAFGYTVYVDNEEVYFRTYEEIASSPNHYFITVDRSVVKDISRMKVTIRSEADSPFHISKIWAYPDFYRLADEEQIYKKMELSFWADRDTEKANQFFSDYSKDYSIFSNAVSVGHNYIDTNQNTMKNRLSTYISLAERVKKSLHIISARWWTHTAHGPDGKGGNFDDLQYQQANYDIDKGIYTSTVPNVWSDTPWPTIGNAYYNSVAAGKIKNDMSYFADRMALSMASGASLPEFRFIMEWGTGAWHYNAISGGDFSPEMVEAAKKDGITFNPEDGISFEEKNWFNQKIAKYNEQEALAYKEGLGYNPVKVINGEVTLPSYQMLENLYSHNTQGTMYISHDWRAAGWQGGISEYFYPSSENMHFDDNRVYDYQMAYGKIACTNLEMAIHNPKDILQDYLKRSYQYGMEFVTLYNSEFYEKTSKYISEIDDMENQKSFAPVSYERNVLDVDYLRDYSPDLLTKPLEGIVSHSNLKLANITSGSEYGQIVTVDDPSMEGIAVYKLSNDGKPFDNTIKLSLNAITDSTAEIEIHAGKSLNSMKKIDDFKMGLPIDWFNKNSNYITQLPEDAINAAEYYVKLVLKSDTGEVGIQAVKALIAWDKSTGQTDKSLPTLKEKRLQSMWIQYRAATEKLMNSYLAKSSAQDHIYQLAQDLFKGGRYITAYHLLSGEISQLLPATYSVKGWGQLARYPIIVKLENDKDPIVVKLIKCNEEEVQLKLISKKILDATILFKGLRKNSNYMLQELENKIYRLSLSGDKDVSAYKTENHDLTISVRSYPEKVEKVTGVVYGVVNSQQGSRIDVQIQDPQIGYYAYSNEFMLSKSCTYTRMQEGDATTTKNDLPQKYDAVKLTFNDLGLVESIEATYGIAGGKIKSYTKPSIVGQVTNGIIELENGGKFELMYTNYGTFLETPIFYGLSKKYPIDEIGNGFQEGDEVTIQYTPSIVEGANPRAVHIKK